ncbi:DUF4367 domain-containing protein [uncultured Robinsoniella sp.]|uniref:DUF4367 domain-containing protein n=1 Tax=uncultured Robinsoniella sp. TaxID=904190 RepID=UPI00374F5039
MKKNNNHEDLLIDRMVYGKALSDGKKILQLNDALRTDSEYTPNAEQSHKFDAFIVRELKHKKVKRYIYTIKHFTAAILILCTAALLVSLTSQAVRNKFLNTMMNFSDKYTEIQLSETHKDIDLTEYYLPKYIPVGFTLNNTIQNDAEKILIYNSIDSQITLKQYNSNVVVNLDTENAEVSEVSINKQYGMLILKGGFRTLTWTDKLRDKIFIIITDDNTSGKELKKIAESIE